jgi:hypothetical protein
MRIVIARLWISSGGSSAEREPLRSRGRDLEFLEYLDDDLKVNLVGDLEGNLKKVPPRVSDSCFLDSWPMAETSPLVDCRFSLLVVEFRSLWVQKRVKADVSGLASSLAVALFDHLSKFGSDAYTIRLIHS